MTHYMVWGSAYFIISLCTVPKHIMPQNILKKKQSLNVFLTLQNEFLTLENECLILKNTDFCPQWLAIVMYLYEK